ncbi:MAG: decarboxylating 6-phosphogluconate dehydrogenase [Ardenticatenaceae bacterium]|nr:decarboxylating 6-phosphogluconate dehydrogenase [Ardenticatenaceae bacterium]
MQIAMIGLGKMGANMASRLLKGGHDVFAFDLNEKAIQQAESEGAVGVRSLEELFGQMSAPRAVWVMVPAGKPTESTVNRLGDLLAEGDTIIDGGNSNYKDTVARSQMLSAKGIEFVDVGTSGGVWGLTEGYSMMVGGSKAAVERLRPVLETLAPAAEQGWGHVGPSGSGHFVKMIHNGIEYGMMQAYAEGFEIMKEKGDFDLDLHQISQIWRHGSVVRSWLLDLIGNALDEDQDLAGVAPWVSDSGEGRWTVFEAIDLDVSAPVITLALQSRLISRDDNPYQFRLLSAMRNQFGGHAIKSS